MRLEDVLRAFGLGRLAGPIQPDVSGATMGHLLHEMGRDPALLIPALGSLYEDVHRTEPSPGLLHLDLWREGQPMASVLCDHTQATRCTFTYWDPEPRVNAFLQQASAWADAKVGPLREGTPIYDAPVFVASNDTVEVSLSRVASGEEAEARLTLAFLD